MTIRCCTAPKMPPACWDSAEPPSTGCWLTGASDPFASVDHAESPTGPFATTSTPWTPQPGVTVPTPQPTPSRYTETHARLLLAAMRLPRDYGSRVVIGASPSRPIDTCPAPCWPCVTTHDVEVDPCQHHQQVTI